MSEKRDAERSAVHYRQGRVGGRRDALRVPQRASDQISSDAARGNRGRACRRLHDRPSDGAQSRVCSALRQRSDAVADHA